MCVARARARSATQTLFEPISRTPPFHFAVSPPNLFPSCRPSISLRSIPSDLRAATRGWYCREKLSPGPTPSSQCEIRQPLLKLATTLLTPTPFPMNNTRIIGLLATLSYRAGQCVNCTNAGIFEMQNISFYFAHPKIKFSETPFHTIIYFIS